MEVVLQEGGMVVVVRVVVVETPAILEIQVQVQEDLRETRQGTVVVDQHHFHRTGRCRSTFSCRFAQYPTQLTWIRSSPCRLHALGCWGSLPWLFAWAWVLGRQAPLRRQEVLALAS